MKPSEVIKTIKIAMAEVEWEYPMDYQVAFEKTIEALEKQMPKKPFLECTERRTPIAMWHCPVCKNEIISNWNRDIANSYCHHCGQAIDWSDEE